jgi:hypothetical protein
MSDHLRCHSCEGGKPVYKLVRPRHDWITAFAGMTSSRFRSITYLRKPENLQRTDDRLFALPLSLDAISRLPQGEGLFDRRQITVLQ